MCYGAWVSKKEIIPVIEYQNHDVIAIEEIFKCLKVKEGREDTRHYTIYRIMYRLGYINLRYNEEDGYNLEYWNQLKPSKFQQEIIENAENISLFDVYYLPRKEKELQP